eukprot:595546-Rhodomonas_salina.1
MRVQLLPNLTPLSTLPPQGIPSQVGGPAGGSGWPLRGPQKSITVLGTSALYPGPVTIDPTRPETPGHHRDVKPRPSTLDTSSWSSGQRHQTLYFLPEPVTLGLYPNPLEMRPSSLGDATLIPWRCDPPTVTSRTLPSLLHSRSVLRLGPTLHPLRRYPARRFCSLRGCPPSLMRPSLFCSQAPSRPSPT